MLPPLPPSLPRMRRLGFEIATAVGLTLAAIVAAVPSIAAGEIQVTGAFARASATPSATSGVVYFNIRNQGQAADRLIAVATPAAGMAELHDTKASGETMSMVPVAMLDLPAGATVALKPGGLHLMLMDLKQPLKVGTTLHLDLSFAKAGHIGIDVPVKGVAASAP
jgi:copper(I)-binding protein